MEKVESLLKKSIWGSPDPCDPMNIGFNILLLTAPCVSYNLIVFDVQVSGDVILHAMQTD